MKFSVFSIEGTENFFEKKKMIDKKMRSIKIGMMILGLCLLQTISSQSLSEADSLFYSGDFSGAVNIYQKLLQDRPNDLQLNYKNGIALFHQKEYQTSVKYLEKASTKIPNAFVFLGDIAHFSYEFDEAAEFYEKALAEISPTEDIYIECLQKQSRSEKGLAMLSLVENIQIVDSLTVGKSDFFKHYKLSADAGTLFPIESKIGGIFLTGFMTERKDRRIFADTIGGQCDIFLSNKIFDGWTEKQSLSSVINTSSNEIFPFLSSDGITLYFSSDNPESLGGYDIFVSRYRSETNEYLKAENVGMPFNSPFNDYLMAIDEDGQTGWFATDRYQDSDSVVIYRFYLNENKIYLGKEDERIIEYAQLKKNDWKQIEETDSSWTDSQTGKDTDSNEMFFVVTDNLIYNSLTQFKNEDAKLIYLAALEEEKQIELLKKILVDLRTEYIQKTKKEAKEDIEIQIVDLECKITEKRFLPSQYYNQARELEQKEINQE